MNYLSHVANERPMLRISATIILARRSTSNYQRRSWKLSNERASVRSLRQASLPPFQSRLRAVASCVS